MIFFLFLPTTSISVLIEAGLTSTLVLYFRAKVRENIYPCKLGFAIFKPVQVRISDTEVFS